jgi:2'-5' RNA ligase
MTKRLFFAIELPDRLKQELKSIRTTLPGAKWVDPLLLHVTLLFVGDCSIEKQAALEETVALFTKKAKVSVDLDGEDKKATSPTLSPATDGTNANLKIGGACGAFGSPARVLWLPINDKNEWIKTLQTRLRLAVSKTVDVESKESGNAHLTLARLNVAPGVSENPESVKTFLSVKRPIWNLEVTEFVLYSSVLTPSGPIYHVEKRFVL